MPKPEKEPEAPVYTALRSNVVDGVPWNNELFLEFARVGTPLLEALGRSGIDLTQQDRAERLSKLWEFINQRGQPVLINERQSGINFKRLHG